MWCWCCQQDDNSAADTQEYLNCDDHARGGPPRRDLRVFSPGNAQSASDNRYARNEQIRDYCRNNGKWLFDFGDIDCWHDGERHTEDGIPTEHPHYSSAEE